MMMCDGGLVGHQTSEVDQDRDNTDSVIKSNEGNCDLQLQLGEL